jgi:RNA polymerase sigma-70 factor (ECF subfamily)
MRSSASHRALLCQLISSDAGQRLAELDAPTLIFSDRSLQLAETTAIPTEQVLSCREAEWSDRSSHMSDANFRNDLLAAIPGMRAFAISLTNNADLADDLVQGAITNAWASRARFEAGSNINAWLFTILRNGFYSNYRKRTREVDDPEQKYAARLASAPEQHGRLDLQDMRIALAKLPATQREALLLVAAEGMSYDEAAQVCGVAVGTVKSRVNRARAALAQLLAIDSVEDLGPDRTMHAAVQSTGPA